MSGWRVLVHCHSYIRLYVCLFQIIIIYIKYSKEKYGYKKTDRHTHTHARARTHTHTHTNTHTHTHTHTHICPFLECLPKNKNNSYIDYTTTLYHRLTYHLSENSTIKHLIIKYNNSTNQLTSSDVRKIFTDNTIIIYKNNNKKRLQILEAICIKISLK